MDKTKNNKVYIYAYAFSFIIILIFFSFLINQKNKVDDTKIEKEIVDVNNFINSWDYEEAISVLEQKWTWSIDREEKMTLVYSYLNYWNYYYKEEDFSKKAMDILNTLDDDYEVLYYKGYANEIIKNYTGSLEYYNKWLEIKEISNESKSLILNQIWHVYDLKWDLDKSFKYYEEAYNLDNKNANALSNLWRYYFRTDKNEEAYKYLNLALNLTTNLPLKSELCFSLSSIELELNWLTPDIDKSIDYAKKSIDYYPSYAMWYVALARWLYMKNDLMYAKEIEENLDKSIKLNPNWYYSYELYAMHEFDKRNYNKAYELFEKAAEAIDKDMILMDSVRENDKNVMYYKMYIFSEIQNHIANQKDIYTFFDKILPIKAGRSILKQQFKRNLNGILDFIPKDKELDILLEKINKS